MLNYQRVQSVFVENSSGNLRSINPAVDAVARMRALLKRMLDPAEFLSDYGIRARFQAERFCYINRFGELGKWIFGQCHICLPKFGSNGAFDQHIRFFPRCKPGFHRVFAKAGFGDAWALDQNHLSYLVITSSASQGNPFWLILLISVDPLEHLNTGEIVKISANRPRSIVDPFDI